MTEPARGAGLRSDSGPVRPLPSFRSPDANSYVTAAAAIVALGFFVLHLPFLPASLEDLDSINFALGLHRYDVAQHQPHPPGYPVFIVLARGARHLVGTDARALSAVGIVAGALGVLALFALFRQFEALVAMRSLPRATVPAGTLPPAQADQSRTDSAPATARTAWIAWAAALVAATSPLYWFTAARPLSDATGLAAAIAVQAWTLVATTPWSLAGAAFCAGLATGIRSQVAWLTLPLLLFAAYRSNHQGTNTRRQLPVVRVLVSSWLAGPFALGVLVWAVPMVIVTGGPATYWRALFGQGAEDLTGIQMLWTTPTPRVFGSALYYALVAPWAIWSIAVVVLVFAVAGAVLASRFWRPAVIALLVAYAPYFIFDLLFQETFTTRYALPLVVPVAYLAVRGAAAFGWRPGLAVALALSIFDAHVGGTSVAAYAREKAPAFRMLDDMTDAGSTYYRPPMLAADRREQLDLRRPIAWLGSRMPVLAGRLPSPPQHEWLELVKYWNGSGSNPVWFVADPLRTDIDLVQHDDPIAYRWHVPYPVLLGGARPNEMDWYRLLRPSWYVGEGWALTPEAAGVSQADHHGLTHGPIEAWVDRAALGSSVLIGGRNLDPSGQPVHLTASVDNYSGGRPWFDMNVGPGFFLKETDLPPLESAAPARLHLVIGAVPAADVAIEQFAIGPTILGFGPGWYEREYKPSTGQLWRWLSERGEVRIKARGAVALHVEGESPRRYFSRPSRLTIRTPDNRVLYEDELSSDFSFTITIPAALTRRNPDQSRQDREGQPIIFETDQVYVPAERSLRTRDRRHLGLRIFKCELRAIDLH